MESLSSAFSSLPYFNPMMMINTSGMCAITKIIQCRDLGCSQVNISRKFEQDPDYIRDLSRADFMARKNVLEQFEDWTKEHGKKPLQKGPYCLFIRGELHADSQIVKASAKKTVWHLYPLNRDVFNFELQKDWGHLLFTDLTTKRFLIVMIFPEVCDCGNFSHHDYDAMTKYQADRMMSLLKYLHHNEGKPDWVHATYVTPEKDYELNPEFLNHYSALSPAEIRDRLTNGISPILHVTQDTFVPSLLATDIEKIENLLKMKGSKKYGSTRGENGRAWWERCQASS